MISNLIPHSLNLSVNWMVSVHWETKCSDWLFLASWLWPIFKHIWLNFNSFNHFKVVKCLQMTKTKHLCKVKQHWKRLFFAFFVTFSNRGTIRQKANARAWNYADCPNSKIEWRTHLSNDVLNGISLHSVGFELFKKVLLVALGICLSIYAYYWVVGIIISRLVRL